MLCGSSGKIKFVQAKQLGIAADLGANWLLQRIAGRGVALASILLGETLDAQRALTLGLVWEVVDDSQLNERAHVIAGSLANLPVEAVLASRRLVDASATASFSDILEMERLVQRDLCARPELAAKIEAFVAGQGQRSDRR